LKKIRFARRVYCLLMILCLVLIPIASAAYTISGQCYGFYYYDDINSGEFQGVIQQQGTKIWGSFSEPRTTFGPDEAELSSKFTGEINDRMVVFTKTYDYNPNHQVVYRGTYDPNERKIKGNWYIGKTSGRFDITLQ
jgi:hypothetical protein